MKKHILFLLCLIAVASTRAQVFADHFADKTLRVDYIFNGNASGQAICLDGLSALPTWAGRKHHLAELPLQGNGQIVMRNAASGKTIYTTSFSSLFQDVYKRQVVGFSFPLFSNKGKVKIAKAQAMNIDFQKDNARVKASSELWQLYEEARNLDASMQEYKRTFQEQQDLTLLKQALVGGQISMIEYFVEVSVVYQSKTNLLQLENQYQKAMARIYKNEL